MHGLCKGSSKAITSVATYLSGWTWRADPIACFVNRVFEQFGMWLGTVVDFDSIQEGMRICMSGPMLALRTALKLLGQNSVIEWEWLEGGRTFRWLNHSRQPTDERQALVWHLLVLQDMRSLGRNTVHERGLDKLDVQTSLQWRAYLGKSKDMLGPVVQFSLATC